MTYEEETQTLFCLVININVYHWKGHGWSARGSLISLI